MSSKDVSMRLLQEIGELQNLREISLEQLQKIKGIGKTKAAIIKASLELYKRVNTKSLSNQIMRDPKNIFESYRMLFLGKKQEYFYALYLDNSKRVISQKLLFIGTINYSVVHPREIFKEAYLKGATSIICIHNHPSDNVFPSKQDYELTQHLIKIGKMMDIKIDDHIIIGETKYYSFFENHDIL